MAKSEEIANAVSDLLSVLATSFGRIASTFHATSTQLTATHIKIQDTKDLPSSRSQA
ncbi:hypothetical protein CCP2SC5_170015 [Azospirillaceae bacterium]